MNAIAAIPKEISHKPYIKDLLQAGGQVYLVGGPVRDFMLKRPHKDWDLLVQHLSYDKIKSLLAKYGNINMVGKSFGVLKFQPQNEPGIEIDISLPRTEQSTGSGHKDFKINADPELPVELDLARRDFTINAMAFEIATGKLVDPFFGMEDLEHKIIRQVFEEALQEDPLRILRAIQFAARLGFSIEEKTLQCMGEHAPLLEVVPPERIILELKKLFTAPKPSRGFDLMRECGVLPLLFPFIHKMIGVLQPRKKNQDVYTHTMQVLDASCNADEIQKKGDLNLMFAALLHDAGKPYTVRVDETTQQTTFYGHQIVSARIAKKWLRHFKLTTIGVEPEKVTSLVEHHMFETKAHYTDRAIRRFINKVGQENILDLIDLRIADKKGGRFPDSMHGILKLRQKIVDEMAKKPPFGPRDLAVTGHDLINLGFAPGPILGTIQKFLVEKVLDEPELNTKEQLVKIVLEHFDPKIVSNHVTPKNKESTNK